MRRVLIAVLSSVVMVLSLPLGDGAGAGPNVQAVAGPPAMVDNCPLLSPNIAANHTGIPASEEAIGGFRGAAANEDAAQILVLSPDGTLSVDIEGVSLACVLQELGRQGEIAVRVRRPAAADAVSRKFRDLSLYDGVRLLLRGKSYLLLHAGPANSGDGSGMEPVVAIFVLDSGQPGLAVAPAALKAAPPSNAGAKAPRATDETDPAVRAAALMELAGRNMAQLLGGVLRNTLVRVHGLDQAALADLGYVDGQALMTALADGSADLDHLDGQALTTAMADGVVNAPSVEDLLDALEGIAETAQELSLAPIKQALEDPDPRINELARELLDALPTETLVDAVAVAIQDREPAVRAAALRTLEDMHEFAPVGPMAASAMTDPEPYVRIIAMGLLAYGDPDMAMSFTSDALDDTDPEVRELAAIQLDELSDEFEQQQALN